jgi:hypothetical protein
LLLVQIDGYQFEVDRCIALQGEQKIEHDVAVFASRQTNHDAIALSDHAVIHNRFTRKATEPRFQALDIVWYFDGSDGHGYFPLIMLVRLAILAPGRR